MLRFKGYKIYFHLAGDIIPSPLNKQSNNNKLYIIINCKYMSSKVSIRKKIKYIYNYNIKI